MSATAVQTGERKYHGDETNIFREHEKKYRLVIPAGVRPARAIKMAKTDYSDVIDFANMDHNTESNRKLISELTIQKPRESKHFAPLSKAYTLESAPGSSQRKLGYNHVFLADAGFLNLLGSASQNLPRSFVLGLFVVFPGLIFIPNPFTFEQQKYWIHRCMKNYTIGNPTNISNLEGNQKLWDEWKSEYMEGLRWASLGYHFQWTPRIYTEEHKGKFPQDLGELVADVALQFGYEMEAEAAIVNFYPSAKCYMGGHLDDAEDDMSKPIVSCTFGNTVVFMIGGRTRDVTPTAIFIRSGDIVLMSGEARYCYHAVPRMLAGTCPAGLLEEASTDPVDWADCRSYIQNARINMNCRQVRVLVPEQ